MRFLLDTNILIPLEDSKLPLEPSLANFIRLSNKNGHELLYHPASEEDIREDKDLIRQQQTLDRLSQYTRLEGVPNSPWNDENTKRNDAADNEILYALEVHAVYGLVTEDKGIHRKAIEHGLADSIYAIKEAEDLLRRLHETQHISLPNIVKAPLYALTPVLDSPFFDSLRESYDGFDEWFYRKAEEGRDAWVNWDSDGILGGLCIYAEQTNEPVTDRMTLPGKALKLATFKVGETSRGNKIGELFLKAAFRHASANQIEWIFIHGDKENQRFLIEMLQSFGFRSVGKDIGSDDMVYVKSHPQAPPECDMPAFEYFRAYFPHFQHDDLVEKFIVPIQPIFHRILFPDYAPPGEQLSLFSPENSAGNAIKMAYLCHAQTARIPEGSVVLFYRSSDDRKLTSIGIVESYEMISDVDLIVAKVKRRTVYSLQQIQDMALKPVKVMLFWLVYHIDPPISLSTLIDNEIIKRSPQSIMKITDENFEKIFTRSV